MTRQPATCWLCSDPDIEPAWRHDHGDGKFHWHHRIDPGDGLADPCGLSDLFERAFSTLTSDVIHRNSLIRETAEKWSAWDFATAQHRRDILGICAGERDK